METGNLFVIGAFSLVAIPLLILFPLDGPKPLTIPTEAELVVMERMAKISATLQGECK